MWAKEGIYTHSYQCFVIGKEALYRRPGWEMPGTISDTRGGSGFGVVKGVFRLPLLRLWFWDRVAALCSPG